MTKARMVVVACLGLVNCGRDRAEATKDAEHHGGSSSAIENELTQPARSWGPTADAWWLLDDPCPTGASLRACGGRQLPPSVLEKTETRDCNLVSVANNGMFNIVNPHVSCVLRDGRLHGRVSEWQNSASHSPRIHGHREDTSYELGRPRGAWTVYSSSGLRVLSGTYGERGQLHGAVTAWDEKGRKLGSFEMAHGTGEWTSWSADGRTHSAVSYRAGVRHGPVHIWRNDGTRMVVGHHRDGKRHGAWTHFYSGPGLVKLEEGNYVDGQPDGEWTIWNRRGFKDHVKRYRRGQACGLSIHWNEAGEVTSTEERAPCDAPAETPQQR